MTAITHHTGDRLASVSRSFLPSILKCNATLTGLALADAGIAFDCARKLSTATTASEFDAVLTRHVRQHLQVVSETVAQLSTLAENGSAERDEDMSLTFWD